MRQGIIPLLSGNSMRARFKNEEFLGLLAHWKSKLFSLLDPAQWDFLGQFGEGKVARLASL